MRRAFAVLMALLIMATLFAGVASAQETRSGDTVVVGPDEEVGDLTAFAGTVVIEGTVDGDLRAFGGNVVIDGEVTGDVDAFVGNVRVTGEVGGEMSTAAGNAVVDENATVGALSAAAGHVAIEGTVAGDAEAAAGSVTLGPAAAIEGDLTHTGELNRHPDAQVAGTVTEEATTGPTPIDELPTPPWWLGQAYWFAANLLLGALLVAVLPRFSDDVAVRARNDALKSGGAGLLALVGIPIALGAIAITIVGIPLTIAGVFLFVLLMWVAIVYGRFAVGAWLLSLADVENRWLALVVGLLVVPLVGSAPFLGGAVELVVLLLGLGAFSLALYTRYGERGDSEGAEPTAPR